LGFGNEEEEDKVDSLFIERFRNEARGFDLKGFKLWRENWNFQTRCVSTGGKQIFVILFSKQGFVELDNNINIIFLK